MFVSDHDTNLKGNIAELEDRAPRQRDSGSTSCDR